RITSRPCPHSRPSPVRRTGRLCGVMLRALRRTVRAGGVRHDITLGDCLCHVIGKLCVLRVALVSILELAPRTSSGWVTHPGAITEPACSQNAHKLQGLGWLTRAPVARAEAEPSHNKLDQRLAATEATSSGDGRKAPDRKAGGSIPSRRTRPLVWVQQAIGARSNITAITWQQRGSNTGQRTIQISRRC